MRADVENYRSAVVVGGIVVSLLEWWLPVSRLAAADKGGGLAPHARAHRMPAYQAHPIPAIARTRVRAAVGGLLGGTSLIALLVAAGPSHAADAVRIVNRGANGTEGEILFNWRTFPTEGANGAPVAASNASPIAAGAGAAIELGSIGGWGGSGDFGILRNVPGANGGAGGAVSLINSGAISGGANATVVTPLVSLYSRGGTGGNGFDAFGAGGAGGSVTLDQRGTVEASGIGTPAISLLSQGGAAGLRGGTTTSRGGTSRDRMALDAGGVGGTVTASIAASAWVVTTGANAPALIAASNGGNGGNADANTSTYYGSNGGAGGTVRVTNDGHVIAFGEGASAIVLQSVGGTGGRGAGGAFTSAAAGAPGGNGGTVSAVNTGEVWTFGSYGFGILAQSVGGAGGQGASAAFGSGGGGGAAGVSGAVSVTQSGTILTFGTGATALLAQSVGGGNAIFAFQAEAPTANSTSSGGAGGRSGFLPFTSGGTGGAGGGGGPVTVEQSGAIVTTGDAATGVLLQSIGGGGGTGGIANSRGAFLAVALGGAGGGGGDGGLVTYRGLGGTIETYGDRSSAILAQSIGGGGGTGGYASAQSIGPGLSASSSVGGSGGGGGTGGAVSVSNQTMLSTLGTQSMGIQALSIGGGGGVGGGAGAIAIAVPLVTPSGQSLPSIAIAQSVGGSGGSGGSGGTVTVRNDTLIETLGVGAIGIQAQSIGGGGGNAGNANAYALAVAAPGSPAISSTSSIGGSGGGGGNGASVSVDQFGRIFTTGDQAIGIQAQSIGGGGGNAGAATATSDALSLKSSVKLSDAIGGRSVDGGGCGGAVRVSNTDGLIETLGSGATGIFAQSIGGGGGNGGSVQAATSASLSFDKTLGSLVEKLPLADSLAIVTALGGSGGKGGNGGAVSVETSAGALVRTSGSDASAIFAQSIGGGGGTGGGGSATAAGKASITLSFGGTGGSGGSGGSVGVTNKGVLETSADGAHGIFAQSIGGGGGSGGSLTADTSKTPDTVGQVWASLKDAVGVTAYNTWAADKGNAETKEKLAEFIKDIQDTGTYKDLSDAFKNSDFAKQMKSFWTNATTYLDGQSKSATKLPDVSLTLSFGGNGGAGNTGGDVTVTNTGAIATFGDVSLGVFAQSVGGGGGAGGLGYASGTNKTNLSGTLGGTGGAGNAGGQVSVRNDGTIATTGELSYGLFAQSVGGGGGIGVGSTSSGNKNVSLNLTIGGNGGTGAHGGAVSVTNRGTIATSGVEAHALVAQSVGGGGGAFVMNPANTGATSTTGKTSSTGDAAAEEVPGETILALLKAVGIEQVPSASTASSDKAPAKSGSFTLGGSGGASGNGGAVTISHSGGISTSGTAAFGILAQSIGGGGGLVGDAADPGGHKYTAGLGGTGGAAGNGGALNITFGSGAGISTSGDGATAVFLQSIGGGGGYGGAFVAQGIRLPFIGREGGSSGDGGAISIGMDGSAANLSIATTGAAAHGIFAQSIGGGGGAVTDVLGSVSPLLSTAGRRNSNGNGGEVSIRTSGSIVATGRNAYGIFVQSGAQDAEGALDPTRSGGAIRIRHAGIITGGSDQGAAIRIDGGSFNQIDFDANSVISAVSGRAILGSFGTESITNAGTVIGEIDLVSTGSREDNRFMNAPGGIYQTGGSGAVNLGPNGRFFNDGRFDIGGVGTLATATLTGRLEQSSSGALVADVTSTPAAGQARSDLLNVVGGLSLRGTVQASVVGGLRPETFRIITVDGSLENRATATSWAAGSPFAWNLTQANNALEITPRANFATPAGLTATASERNVMTYLQQLWGAPRVSTQDAMVFGDFARSTSAQDYMQGIDSLSPEESASAAATQTLGTRASMHAALSCPVFTDTGTLMQETNCSWARIIGTWTQQTSSADVSGYDQSAVTYRVGVQREVYTDWFVGVTAGFTQSWQTASDGSSTQGNGGDVALSVKHQVGPWLFSAAGSLGFGNYETDRVLNLGPAVALSNSEWNVVTAGGRLRASYEFAFPDWYIKPYADLDLLYTYMPGYGEQGVGAALRFSSADQWNVAFSPNVEFGGRVNLSPDSWLRPYATVGMTFFAKDSMPVGVSLLSSSLPNLEFVTDVTMPSELVTVSAGAQLFSSKGYEVRAEYKADIAESYLSHEVSARFAVQF
ncbi:autotransporter outer membrane beta-barrel domain-containing protein [Azorhizobium sp. AG788]|uniref:autotransporter outer membrane beta-barrel domain-containing protein n=1 Tax=Azorhizobium sp. AG788 TaxID=2183897 RepID=UPI00313A4D2E